VSQFALRARLGAGGEPRVRADIEVGPDAWIAQGAIVMSGVTIGAGAVVATRAVVADDVAPYAIVGGVPARRIGQRFSDEQVAALLAIAWWDWPVETIKARVDDLCSPDVDAFIAAYG
jgi:acetyltransferase-like isoleucine patch superfamily enzyme